MQSIWQINNWKAIILCWQIGFRNGLKSGEKPTDREWLEVWRRHSDWLEKTGHTELNTQEFANEMASHGYKVLRIKKKD